MPDSLPRRVALAATLGALLVVGPLAGAAAAQNTTTSAPVTTTTAPPTTTTLPPTTTTAPPTTTTLPATTTTSRPRRTTTTSHPTTTTSTVPATSSSSSATWGWVLLALIVALAVLLVALLLARTRRRGREADWRRAVGPAIAAAELARDLVSSQTESDEAQRRASVSVQVDEAVDGLERVAEAAPDEEHRAMCMRSAEGLRGLAFAVEADHLMRSGGEHPTGEQLAAADAARRNSAVELEAALRTLKGAVAAER